MKLQYKSVRVRMRDGACILTLQIPAWEVPVLQAVHPESTEVGDIVREKKVAPNSNAEHARLVALYGAETTEGGSRGLNYVDAVYGQHAAGLARLREAMQAAVLPAETPVTPPEVAPEISSDLMEAIKPEVAAGLEESRQAARAAAAQTLVGDAQAIA